MTIPYSQILDLLRALYRRIPARERLAISVARNQAFGEDGWKIIILNTGHCPACLIEMGMVHHADQAPPVALELPPIIGQAFPLVMPPGPMPFEIAISAYRFTRFGRGPGRYSIHLRTATGRRFRHAFRIG